MKRYVIGMALGLILVFGLSLDSAGKQRPDSFPDSITEDHTWGGENGWGDSVNPGDEGFQSSLKPWEWIVNRLILISLPDAKTGIKTTEFIVQDQSIDNDEQPGTGNIQSSKGN